MKKLCINPGVVVDIELTNIESNRLFNILKPVVFEDDKHYCCLWGNDLRFGIKGFGHTPLEAIEDWESSVQKRIGSAFHYDKTARYVKEMLKADEDYAAAG